MFDELNNNMLYDNFEKICINGNYDDIKNYIKKYNIDVNYDNGYYLELIAERNDIELFDLMIKLGGNINLNNNGCLRLVAHEGYLELLKYILKNGGDYKSLIGTSALTNYNSVNNYIKSEY